MEREALIGWEKSLEKAPPHNKGVVYQEHFEKALAHLEQTKISKGWFKTLQNSPLDESGIDYVINLKILGPTPFQITSEKQRATAHRNKQRRSHRQERIPTIAIRKGKLLKTVVSLEEEILMKAKKYHEAALV